MLSGVPVATRRPACEHAAMATPLTGKRILVVDDEPDACELIAEELAGATVDAAHTYAEARARLDAARYDLVILDIMGVRGFELLAEFGRKVPCIMLTAHHLRPPELERAIAGGALLFLPKDEIGSIALHAARALAGGESLWPWLFKRVDFRELFGPSWTPPPAPGRLPSGPPADHPAGGAA